MIIERESLLFFVKVIKISPSSSLHRTCRRPFPLRPKKKNFPPAESPNPAATSPSRLLARSVQYLCFSSPATMRASMARFSTAAGVPNSANGVGGAFARSPMTTTPQTSVVRSMTRAALNNSQGPSSFASSSMGRSLLSTSASAKAATAKSKKPSSARGSVAAASAPGEAVAFLKSEGIAEADVAAIAAKFPQIESAGVDTVRLAREDGGVGRIERGVRVRRGGAEVENLEILSFFFDDLKKLDLLSLSLSNSLIPHHHPVTPHQVRPKIALLKKEAGLSDPAKLGAVLSAQPRALLAASLDRHLKPTVAFFTSAEAAGGLGMRKSTLARIATRRPIVLTYDREEQIAPKIKFFAELGLSVAQIRGMVAASPDVLSIGIGNDLQPTVVRFLLLFSFSFFASSFGFGGE